MYQVRVQADASPAVRDRKHSMASKSGEGIDEGIKRFPKPSPTIFFLDGRLVRVRHSSRATNIVYLYDYLDDKEKVVLYSHFKKHRKRAYLLGDACKILGRSRNVLKRYLKKGLINPPVYASADQTPALQKRCYYSEDDLFDIRAAMATIHKGHPRKDGRITPSNVLTEQELRARMGDAIMLYTRTEDGRFIPVWSENTY